MAENYPENEPIGITTDELQGIDINEVDSMQLKDGTVVVIQKEGGEMKGQEYDNQYLEESQGQAYEEYEVSLKDDQSNQLRAKPFMGGVVYPMGPRPHTLVAPMRPPVMKAMIHPRGPVRPVMPMRVVYRARPGAKNQQGGFGQPGFGGQGRQQGGFGQPGFGGQGRQQAGFVQPGFGGQGRQQAGFVQPGFSGPGRQQAGFAQPGFGGPGKQQGGFGQPGFSGPGKQQGGFGQPGFGGQGRQQVGFGQPGFSGPGKQQVGFGQPGFSGQGKQQGGFGQPGFGGQGRQQGGFGQPGFGGQGRQQSGFVQPGFSGPGKQQGGFGQPGFSGPGKQQGGFAQPGFNGPGKQQGGFGQPGPKETVEQHSFLLPNLQDGSGPQQGTNQTPSQGQQQPNNLPISNGVGYKPIVPLNQQLLFPGNNPNQQQGLRARPNIDEEEANYQEEQYAGEEDYYENNEQCQEDTENQLRAKPLIGPGRVVAHHQPVMLVSGYFPGPKKVVPHMHGMGVRRGPVPSAVMGGFNTFQPRFRARPGRIQVARPMLTPLNATFQPKVVGRYGYGGLRPTPLHHGRGFVPPPPIFRTRPRSCSYDERDNDEGLYEEENQCNTSSVCSRCGKEF